MLCILHVFKRNVQLIQKWSESLFSWMSNKINLDQIRCFKCFRFTVTQSSFARSIPMYLCACPMPIHVCATCFHLFSRFEHTSFTHTMDAPCVKYWYSVYINAKWKVAAKVLKTVKSIVVRAGARKKHWIHFKKYTLVRETTTD